MFCVVLQKAFINYLSGIFLKIGDSDSFSRDFISYEALFMVGAMAL
jgi:hypothetical protein